MRALAVVQGTLAQRVGNLYRNMKRSFPAAERDPVRKRNKRKTGSISAQLLPGAFPLPLPSPHPGQRLCAAPWEQRGGEAAERQATPASICGRRDATVRCMVPRWCLTAPSTSFPWKVFATPAYDLLDNLSALDLKDRVFEGGFWEIQSCIPSKKYVVTIHTLPQKGTIKTLKHKGPKYSEWNLA